MALLRLENVSKDYRADGSAVRALDDVSLEARPGEFVAIVGRSGCGKTTLLNLAGAMDFPTSGRVLLDANDTAGLDDADLTDLRRRKVGFIFQFFQLLPTLTAVENIELPLLLAGQTSCRDRAREVLRWVDLEEYSARLPHQLSGGQMQRVAIARAIVNSPKILLADEPTGNLDTANSETVLSTLKELNQRLGQTILMITHNPEAAAACASRTVHMRDGRIAEA